VRADAVIPAAPKDYSKLPYVVDHLRRHVQVDTIHLITPSATGYEWDGVVEHRDRAVLPYDRDELPYRPNWIYQQLLKLFQDVTEHDWYLVVDADTIVARDLPLWNEAGQPILYLGRDQYHGAYFHFNKEMLGFGKVYNHSFLSECTFYSKALVREMLEYMGLDRDGFWERLKEIVHIGCCPAESELYGSYVYHEYPDLYEFRTIKYRLGGKYDSHVWTPKQIRKELAQAAESDPDAHIWSIHSWEGKT